jgi:hypothetical protein
MSDTQIRCPLIQGLPTQMFGLTDIRDKICELLTVSLPSIYSSSYNITKYEIAPTNYSEFVAESL